MKNKIVLEEWETVKDDEFYTIQYHEVQLKSDFISIENDGLFRCMDFQKAG